MISEESIARAKIDTKYTQNNPNHEHTDCIRIAYEWLDAQKKIKACTKSTYALKHTIEKWGGRYVSQSDVEVAACLHPEIKGIYPHFNISARLTEPSIARLEGISEAFKHDYRDRHDLKEYSRREC